MQFKLVYPELLKRLNDSQDEIRIKAAQAIVEFAFCVDSWRENVKNCGNPPFIETNIDNVHWEEIIKSVTIHMDDMNLEVQQSAYKVLETLKRVGCVDGTLIDEHVKSVASRHRSRAFIDQILTI